MGAACAALPAQVPHALRRALPVQLARSSAMPLERGYTNGSAQVVQTEE
jgi:hypothetical protein